MTSGRATTGSLADAQAHVARGAAIAGGGMLYQQAISLVSGLVIARLLGAADYGLFSVLRNYSLISVILAKAGLDLGLTKRLGQHLETERPPEAGTLTLAALVVVAVLSLIIVTLCVAWLGPYLQTHVYGFAGFSSMFAQMILIVPLWGLLQVLSAAFRARLEPGPGVIAEMVLQPTARLLISASLIVMGWGVLGAVWGTILAALIATFYIAGKAVRYFSLGSYGVKNSTWRELLGITESSLTLGVSVGIVTLTRSVDLLILAAYVNSLDLGKYAVAQMLVLLVGLCGAAFGQLMGPLIAQYWKNDQRSMIDVLLKRNTRLIIVATAPMVVVIAIFGGELSLAFGPEYEIPNHVLALLALAQFATGALSNTSWVLSMTGRHASELQVLLVGLAAAVALNFLLVPSFGITGAACATLMSVLSANVARVWLVYRYARFLPVDPSVLWPLALALSLAVPAYIAYFATAAAAPFTASVLGSAAYSFVYYVVGYKAILSVNERQSLRDFIRRLRRRGET
jgi:O-antigen/teichoic acid export membrane protein